MFGNFLTGTIPTEIGLMTALVDFIISHNALSGHLPNQVSLLPDLEQFSVYGQQGLEFLTGPLPSFSGAPKLWYVVPHTASCFVNDPNKITDM
jgi:hypothetical protein